MSDLLELAERTEKAGAEQQGELLWEAFEAVHGPKPPRIHGGSSELDAYLDLSNPFHGMIKAKAYESAAMTLVPEGAWDHMEVYRPDHQTLGWTVHLLPNPNIRLSAFTGFAQSYALALTAAALRALHAGERE